MTRVSIICRSKDINGNNIGYILTFPEPWEDVDEKLFGENSPPVIIFKYDKGVVRIRQEDVLNSNVHDIEEQPQEEPPDSGSTKNRENDMTKKEKSKLKRELKSVK